ncbi:uncharacterized protein LOC6566293 [Drosophila grimshawi]|uniref:GH24556 n=1 Tax=Drosophila grimshawi TaxID=7222 RepID=B4JM10_DROGR|nr:uncharacterized protein LOC6566293 [Drosophila grimshawi]EDV91771.1 GH24556 [Drosophila grimshawi]
MEIGEELRTWLEDKSKQYTARLEFAIKVWQSLDFVYINKHEVICQWLAETLTNVDEELPVSQLQQLFSLRAQPGLVGVATKSALIQALLKRIQDAAPIAGHTHPALIQQLLNFELVQDALRADYDLIMCSYGILFTCYERQLLFCGDDKEMRHADFMLPLLQQLRDYVQRAQNRPRLLKAYTEATLQPLCQLFLQLRERGFCCFEQLAALEMQLTDHLDTSELTTRMSKLPLALHLLVLEAALLNHRYDPVKQFKLINYVLSWSVQWKPEYVDPPEAVITLTTHALESLRKHNIPLQFEEMRKQSAVAFVAEHLLKQISQFRGEHLRQLLMMLCAALRLNPLLIEPNVYQITVWMLCAPKRNDLELRLYAEYLVLLLDMCRRLSRTERFIMQLLKSLREWLSKFELPMSTCNGESKRSRLTSEQEEQPALEQDDDIYLQLLFKTTRPTEAVCCTRDRLAQTWPSQTAGAAFTRLVSQLMSTPSIVIWRMLLHSFADLLVTDSQAVLPVNLNFAIELQATLLSQYLLGTRLAEQVQQHETQVAEQRQHTAQVLCQFGRHLLAREHNRRTMNAFLECVERASCFDLLLAYYWPDGLSQTKLDVEPAQLHKFLPSHEWKLIQQRVHNFGKSLGRQRLQRLELQLIEAGWLLLPNQRAQPCPDALVELVPPQLVAHHLTRAQKQLRLQQQAKQLQHTDLLHDAECVELQTLQLLEDYAASLKEAKIKGTLLSKQLKLLHEDDESALANALRQHCASTKQPALPMDTTLELIEALHQLPLVQLVSRIKSRLWLLIFSLYHDVRRAQLQQQADQLLEQLIDILHFGQPLALYNYFPQLVELLQLVPIDAGAASDAATAAVSSASPPAWRFYETLFGRCIRRLGPGTDVFLASCAQHFRDQLQQSQLDTECRRLLLLAIETLSSGTGVQARRMQRHLQPLLEIYGQFVTHKFRSKKKPPTVYKEFVQQTLSGYAIYLSSCINRAAKQQQQQQQQDEKQKEDKKDVATTTTTVQPIDENFRHICKIYIGHSLNYRNAHAIRLLNVALTHRQLLHLDLDEIEFVLNTYWRQLNADIESASTLDIQCIEPAIKLIIGYKTNEDFLLLLRRLIAQLDGMQRPETAAEHTSLQNVLILLTLFAKCSLSSIKAAMLNEHFELISGNVALRLPPVIDASYRQHVLRLLEAQSALVSNRTVPLSGETLDSILGSMLDINIKRFIIAGGSWSDFVQLHAALSENCLLLLRNHSSLMSDRAAQLTAICQDLVQSIVCYRSERKQAQSLTDAELDGLSELAMKLVTLIAAIAAGPLALAIKRVAPFLLIFTIKQMVATERPTTLFEKVKVHMTRICHELIGICDHRAGHFILRASSEAGAGMYQNLVKEHDKYHKFRGKV